jgi:hypothetical protein
MPNFIAGFLRGKDPLLNGFIALAILSLIALGCTCKDTDFANLGKNTNSAAVSDNSTDADVDDGKDADMPDDRLLKALVKSTTAQFANAISTEDFTTLHSNASKDFQETYTPEQAKEIFADAIKNKRALLPMLAKLISMDPEFSPEPYIRREQNTPILVVKGKYDTKPRALEFEYEYVKRAGSFKLLKLILK